MNKNNTKASPQPLPQAAPRLAPQTPPIDEDTILGSAYDPRLVRRMWRFVRPYRWRLLVAVIFMTIATIANVSGPYLIKIALDNGIAGHDTNILLRTVGLYLLAAVILWIFTFMRIRIMAVTGQ